MVVRTAGLDGMYILYGVLVPDDACACCVSVHALHYAITPTPISAGLVLCCSGGPVRAASQVLEKKNTVAGTVPPATTVCIVLLLISESQSTLLLPLSRPRVPCR